MRGTASVVPESPDALAWDRAGESWVRSILVGWNWESGAIDLLRVYTMLPMTGTDVHDGGMIGWLPDLSGWILGDNLVVERTTGALVWQMPQLGPGSLRITGLGSVLATEISVNDNRTEIQQVRFPGAPIRIGRTRSRPIPAPRRRPSTSDFRIRATRRSG